MPARLCREAPDNPGAPAPPAASDPEPIQITIYSCRIRSLNVVRPPGPPFRALVSVPLWDMGLLTSGEALGTYLVGLLKDAFRIRARLPAGPDVTITVADTGDRADTARDRAHGGSGIGLTIALLQQFVDKFRASPAFTPNTGGECTGGVGTPSRRDTYQPVGLKAGVSATGG